MASFCINGTSFSSTRIIKSSVGVSDDGVSVSTGARVGSLVRFLLGGQVTFKYNLVNYKL